MEISLLAQLVQLLNSHTESPWFKSPLGRFIYLLHLMYVIFTLYRVNYVMCLCVVLISVIYVMFEIYNVFLFGGLGVSV